MNGYWILLNAFSVSINIIIWFFFICQLIWWIILIDFFNATPVLHTWDKFCLVNVYKFFMHWWIQFVNIFLRNFASKFRRDIGMRFTIFVLSLADFGIKVILVSYNELISIPSSYFLKEIVKIDITCLMFGKIFQWCHPVLRISFSVAFSGRKTHSLMVIRLIRSSISSWASLNSS